MKKEELKILKVGISGGSLGGLLAGVLLHELGVQVTLLEGPFKEDAPQGAGILAPPEMLEYFQESKIVNTDKTMTLCEFRRIMEVSSGIDRLHQSPQYFSSWGGLYRNLKRALPNTCYERNQEVESFEERDQRVEVLTREGEKVFFDLLICADGAHSPSRDRLLPGLTPQYAGYVAFRGLINEFDLTPHLLSEFSDRFTHCYLEKSQILTHFIPSETGDSTLGARRLNWVWYINADERTQARWMIDRANQPREFVVPQGYLNPSVHTFLKKKAETDLPEQFRELVLRTTEPSLQAVYDLDVPQMRKGRILLLGDSAFIIRPETFASTYKAFIDARALVEELDKEKSLEEVLMAWELQVLEVGKYYSKLGRSMSAQSGFGTSSPHH